MRTHGWRGQPPSTDQEAVARILEAADRCIRRSGASTSISDVAAELGVSRATIYRYFDATTDLLQAATELGTQEFVLGMRRLFAGLTDPAEIIIEGIVETVTQAPTEPYLRLLFEEPTHTLLRSVTSDPARELGRAVLSESTAVDWTAPGLGEHLDEVLEWALRTIQSLLSDRAEPPRSREELREFLWRWIGPSIRSLIAGTDARHPRPAT